MKRLRSAIGLTAVLMLGVPSLAPAQGNRWERQVRDQLQRAAAALRPKGGGAQGGQLNRTGALNAEESESFSVTLEAGKPYQIIAVCDNDCTSLGLVLATTANNEVAADRSSENFPVLQFTPQVTMQYHVRIEMTACQMNPCWYGVAVYRK